MSIYDFPLPGVGSRRSLYPKLPPGFGAPAMQTASGAVDSLYGTPTPVLPPPEPEPEIDPSDPSLLRRAADVSLGGLSMAGNLLDLPGSMVRDFMTWLPGGIEARNPFDQLFSPFNDNNRTSGEEILQNAGLAGEGESKSTLGSIGRFVGGTGLEIALDPLTYLTFGASAVGKGGKLAKSAGLFDDASKVASKKAGKAVGKRQARQMVSARELAENVPGDSMDGINRLLDAYNGGLPDADRVSDIADIPSEILDAPIGGNVRMKLPFMEEKILNDVVLPKVPDAVSNLASSAGSAIAGVPIPRTGKTVGDYLPESLPSLPAGGRISGEAIAEVGDKVAEAVRYGQYSPVRLLAPVFDRAVRGAKTADVQKSIRDISQRIDEQSQLARDNSIGIIKAMDESGYLKGDGSLDASLAMTDYLEGVAESLPEHLQPIQPQLDEIRRLTEELDSLNREYSVNTKSLENLGYVNRKIYDEAGELVSEEPIASPVRYTPRVRRMMTGPLWRAIHNSRRTPVKDGFGIAREDYTRHLPTSTLQRMSIDPDFAGKFDRGVMGRREKIADYHKGEPNTGRLGSEPVDLLEREQMRERFFQKYDPFELIDRNTLDDEAVSEIERQHAALFDSITELNREQVEKGVPMYAINPAENLLKRLDSGYMTIASTQGARDLISQQARLRGGNTAEVAGGSVGTESSSFNLLDQIREMGMDYDEGKAALVESLGEPAAKVRDSIMSRKQEELAEELFATLDDALGGDGFTKDELVDALQSDPQDVLSVIGEFTDGKTQETAVKRLDEFIGIDVTPDEILREFEIDSEIGADIARVNRGFSGPEEASAAAAAFDVVTNLFKGNVTAPFPSFHIRNVMSGFTQNALNGIVDPRKSGPAKFVQPYKDAISLMKGDSIPDADEIPYFKRQGLSAEEASDQIKDLVFSRKLVDSPGDHNDIVGNLGGSVADQILGRQTFAQRGARPEGVSTADSLKPWKTPGVSGGEDAFAPVRWGRAAGDFSEQALRTAPFIALLRQGVDPDEAARQVKRLQVDYSDLTTAERNTIRRAIPFYTFQKGATRYLADELTQRPGGAVAMTIKGAENASGNDPGAPAHIRNGLNIPLGENEDGTKHYFTGAGLMHEPPLQMLSPSVSGGLFNIASMLHPAIKLPIEMATNESLFQEGPGGGGRSLDDMDPLLGRTLANLVDAVPGIEQDQAYQIPGGSVLEPMIANSPAARYLHQIRKATDGRKGIPTRLLDGLTGFRFASVDPAAQDAVLREQVEQLMRDIGGRDFSHAYIPDSVMESLSGDDLERAQQMQALLKLLNQRQSHRKKTVEVAE